MIYFETYRDVDASDAVTRRGGLVLRKRVIALYISYGEDHQRLLDKSRMFDFFGLFLKVRIKWRCNHMLNKYWAATDGICDVDI